MFIFLKLNPSEDKGSTIVYRYEKLSELICTETDLTDEI